MEKSLDKKISQINNIVKWWKTKLLLKLVKKNYEVIFKINIILKKRN